MPELPEVETIKRGLSEKLVGLEICDIEIMTPKSFIGEKEKALNRRITGVDRRAKVIRITLDKKLNLLFHLKMTGQLIYLFSSKRLAGGHPSHDWHAKLPNKHTRLVFKFNDGSALYFNDLRKFGWCKIVSDKEVDDIFKEYGPEPFSNDFTIDYLKTRAQKVPNRNIKQFLMDQTIVAGVGNIYNDETLFLAKISPFTKAVNLSTTDWERLQDKLHSTLNKAIEYGGTTDSDYVDASGKKGGMQDHLNVYHKAGEPCKSCKGTIQKTKIGGRGTYYCPDCQRLIS